MIFDASLTKDNEAISATISWPTESFKIFTAACYPVSKLTPNFTLAVAPRPRVLMMPHFPSFALNVRSYPSCGLYYMFGFPVSE